MNLEATRLVEYHFRENTWRSYVSGFCVHQDQSIEMLRLIKGAALVGQIGSTLILGSVTGE
jgi:hypothetical protein